MIQSIDQGVILYLSGDGLTTDAGTVKDINGVAFPPGTLNASYKGGSGTGCKTVQVGKGGKLAVWVAMKQHTAASITVKVTGTRGDANNPSLWGPSILQLIAQDDGSAGHATIQAAECTFTKVNIGTDTVFYTVIETTSEALSGDLIVSAHADAGGLNAKDWIIVGISTQ